jgi:DNA-binding response OmpR family regulator
MIDILLLEDDELFAFTLIDFLEDDGGFHIEHISDGKEFLNKVYDNRYDIYLLDVNVPNINGLDLLKEIRASGDNTPAIYLTSFKDKETLKEGFVNGADDFLTKPFDMDELVLRINSIAKRINKQTNAIIDNVTIDFGTKSVLKDSKEIRVGLKVIDLIELFYQHNHSVVTKEMIINRLWSPGEEYSEGSIRVYINQIKKIFDNTRFKINNIKNVGYKIEY